MKRADQLNIEQYRRVPDMIFWIGSACGIIQWVIDHADKNGASVPNMQAQLRYGRKLIGKEVNG